MKVTLTQETRHDGARRFRLTMWLRWSHEPKARRYREGFASRDSAVARRKELLAVLARSGMDGVCELAWGAAARAAVPRDTLVPLAEEFVAAKERAGRRERSTGDLRYKLAALARAVGDVPPGQITPAQIQELLDDPTLAPQTRINRAVAWGNFFGWCGRQGLVTASPLERVELPSGERKLPAVLSAWRVARLIAAAWRDGGTRESPGPMLAHCLLLFFSGVRPQEIGRLRWEVFGWDRGEVVLDEATTKISRVRHCRLDPRLAKILQALQARGDIPGYWSRRMFERVRRRAGCGGKAWVVDIGRHTYASTRYALATAEHDLAHDMGNSVAVLREYYINRLVRREDAAKCWRVLDVLAKRLRPKRR